MLFGHRSGFAIEVDVELTNGDLVFGTLALWISGTRIGDHQRRVILSSVSIQLTRFLDQIGLRDATRLSASSNLEMFSEVTQIYSDDTTQDYKVLAEKFNIYNPFILCPGLSESFDGDWIIIIEEKEHDRILWRTCDAVTLSSVILDRSDYIQPMYAFINFLEALKDNVSG